MSRLHFQIYLCFLLALLIQAEIEKPEETIEVPTEVSTETGDIASDSSEEDKKRAILKECVLEADAFMNNNKEEIEKTLENYTGDKEKALDRALAKVILECYNKRVGKSDDSLADEIAKELAKRQSYKQEHGVFGISFRGMNSWVVALIAFGSFGVIFGGIVSIMKKLNTLQDEAKQKKKKAKKE